MNRPRHRLWLTLLALAAPPAAAQSESVLDQLGEHLTWASPAGTFRARVSGWADLEAYFPSEPVSDLLFSDRGAFVNPRLTVFLDANVGRAVYVFAQARWDRRFDPADRGQLRPRLDEYALRFSTGPDRTTSWQLGQFATVVGEWTRRHGSWDDPFVTAPLPYDNLTGMWDRAAPASPETLLSWAHVRPVSRPPAVHRDKNQRLPIIWGPSYATGAAVARRAGRLDVALEVKNASLSSRPKVWNDHGDQWDHPTVSSRIGWRPDLRWSTGLSVSSGSYLQPLARRTLPADATQGDYRQTVITWDGSYAHRHLQVWAEAHAARFEAPGIGHADTFAYFIESKIKLTPRFSTALRWNQQTFGTIQDSRGEPVRWGRNVWRVDVSPTYRWSPHTQVKLQFSLRHETPAHRALSRSVAVQYTVRF